MLEIHCPNKVNKLFKLFSYLRVLRHVEKNSSYDNVLFLREKFAHFISSWSLVSFYSH